MFKKIIWDYYKNHKRNLIWRKNITPYHVLISEIMLQQTQVSRVEEKFPAFITAFPHFKKLANTPLKDIYIEWQGMGYNRRALYLKKIAEKIIKEHKGKLPQDPKTLETFPGIGHATAHSMVAFAYNQPVVFIETNIRRVFIHHFFKNKQNVHDSEIIPLVKKTLDVQNPREWYYALMDYGSYLAKQVVNPNRKSIHYMKQAQFKGSNRQIRGAILRLLSAKESVQQKDLIELGSWHTIERNLRNLIKEGLVEDNKGKYSIS